MALRFIEGHAPWTGEAIGGVRHPRTIEARWSTAELAAAALEVAPEVPPEVPVRHYIKKTELIRRMTPAEVSALLSALEAADAKAAALFDAATLLDGADPEFAQFEAGVRGVCIALAGGDAAAGNARADVLLEFDQ